MTAGHCNTECGLTLVEVMLASTLAVLVVIGIGQVDVTRVRMDEEIRKRSGVTSPNRLQASIAALQIAQHLERTDRLVLCQDGTSTAPVGVAAPCTATANQFNTDLFFRTPIAGTSAATNQGSCTTCQSSLPDACCFDIGANYRWDEFRLNQSTGELKLYTNVNVDCSNVNKLVPCEVASYVIQSRNDGTPASGAAPPTGTNLIAPNNNNVLRYSIEWADATGHSQVFPGEVTIRGAGYTNAPFGNQNPALGDVNPPPGTSCPL